MDRRIRQLSLRIAVTGTRGKSTVTRLIAAILKEAGYPVLAKTTGSRAILILPDGREEEIIRRGLPAVLEQKKVLRAAANLGARALVAEMMSVRPECLAVESRALLRPQVLVVTNVRLDHREEMGWTKPEIARSLASAFLPGGIVFILGEDGYPDFERAAASVRARIIRVKKNGLSSFSEENKALAAAVAAHLDVSPRIIRQGLASARPDFGSFQMWEAGLGSPPTPWILVSAFAANEPESSGSIVARIQEKTFRAGRPLIALLNFRSDRGDRTRQWLDAQERDFFAGFRRIYVVGAHGQALRARKNSGGRRIFIPLPGRSPSVITDRIASLEGTASILIGLGNIGGIGEALVEHWQKIGRTYAL